MVFSKNVRALAAIAMFGALAGPRAISSQVQTDANAGNAQRPKKLEKQIVELEDTKRRVASILREENGCSAWFREADPDPASVFESLHIEIGKKNREFVLRSTTQAGDRTYKHPWGARSNQLAGRNSVVEINPSWPFYVLSLPVMEIGGGGGLVSFEGHRILTVGGFAGDTPEARLAMLLHELAHVIGRIPQDDDSWDGRSTRNSEEVIRNCKSEIQNFARDSRIPNSSIAFSQHHRDSQE